MARPHELRAVLFDFDGTLCDTERPNLELVRGVLLRLGAPVTDEELLSLAGTAPDVSVPPLLERYGSDGTVADYERLRDDCFPTYDRPDLAFEPGVRELLTRLRARGVKTAVVSTTASRSILTALARLGALSLFDAVVTGDMVAARKPAPDPYARALELLGVRPGDAVVVEDSPSGVASGHAAGCHVVAYTGCAVGQDVSRADETVADYAELDL